MLKRNYQRVCVGVRTECEINGVRGLAPVIVQKIGEVIHLLKKRGISILIAEQNLHFAGRIADRFYLVDEGRVTATLDRDEFLASRERVEVSVGV